MDASVLGMGFLDTKLSKQGFSWSPTTIRTTYLRLLVSSGLLKRVQVMMNLLEA